MNWPDLCVMLLTYDRLDYAVRTMRAVEENLCYSGSWVIHIADDGSPGDYIENLERARSGDVHHTNSQQRGYGASYNLATQHVHEYAEIILPLEDDWELVRPLDLDPLVRVLLEDERVDCIRLGYIGYTQELRAKFIWSGDPPAHFLLLDPDSPEHHVWAGHPRLETRERQRKVGLWPEGVDPGMTEFSVAHNEAAREGVVWPLELIHPSGDLFKHIGTVQARTDQRKAVS